MGIQGLWDAVSAAGVSSRVELLRGKKVSIDGSFWIGHCLASESNVRTGYDIYGTFFLRICYLLEKRILPIFVFDGRPPDAKRRTLMRRAMEREKFSKNLKLLAFKALAVQMKHLAKNSNNPVFKASSFMKKRDEISHEELKQIADNMDILEINHHFVNDKAEPLEDISSIPQHDERLFSSEEEFEDITAIADAVSSDQQGRDTSIDIFTMPRSYKALKKLSRSGLDVNLTDAAPTRVLDSSYFDNEMALGLAGSAQVRSRNMVELPIDCSIKKESYSQLPGEVRYHIMQQIKDAWMYDDRVNLLQLKSSLSEFSNLQVESYLRNVEINREIENIKRDILKDTCLAGVVKNEDGLHLEDVKKGIPENEIFDYNTIETKKRKKSGFLNDLSADMKPEPYHIVMGRILKQENKEVDDSIFLNDSEIFGDLVKGESDEEFEVVDQRHHSIPTKSIDALKGHYQSCSMNMNDDWDIEEEIYVPPITQNGNADNKENAREPSSVGDADASYDTEIDDLSATSESDASRETHSESLPEFSSSASKESPEESPDMADDELEASSIGSSESEDGVACSETRKKKELSLFSNASVSAGTAILTHREEDAPEIVDTCTPMYKNELEYVDYLKMEKLFSRYERSQTRKEQWDKMSDLLDLFGVPYMVAPAEAEAQCAHLNNIGVCYGVISDDSDTLAFGASRVFKNFYSGSVFEVYLATRISSELGLAREQIALLAIICGCDYTAGVRGIGVVNALEVIKAFPKFDDLYEFRKWATSECDLDKVTEDDCPIRRAYKLSHVNYRLHWSFCTDFPNREAYNLFLSPVVSSTFEPRWEKPNYEGIARFMEMWSSLPPSEVGTCLSRLQSQDDFDGFILEDLVPEIHAQSYSSMGKSLKANRKKLKKRMESFKEFLELRGKKKTGKTGTRHCAPDSTPDPVVPVAYIRSKRMLESIEGIKQYVKSQQNEKNS
ncbi:PIN-like domain superfamily protein [Babesia gibsoni]|uniref:PIN-like domain superfamily protein n=1 Tax=Babesia gibsoni TaxID=33632 RepID=A0AAD8LRW0_BABGI|nr:PIN-like domain superfamily protein [Babesia gibsoni]